MAQQYKIARIPTETYLKLMEKKHKMEEKIFKMTNMPVRISVPKLMKTIADQTIFVKDDYLVGLKKKNGKAK